MGWKYQQLHRSWIYNLMCNQCLLRLSASVQIPFMAEGPGGLNEFGSWLT
jgi:hypothetical protein